MSALAACTSPSGHALHTKGWGSILLLHVCSSRYQARVWAPVSPLCEAAKRIQRLSGHLPHALAKPPRKGTAFPRHGTFYAFAAFLCSGQGWIQPVFQLNWEGFPKESICTIKVNPAAASGRHHLQKVRQQADMKTKCGPR